MLIICLSKIDENIENKNIIENNNKDESNNNNQNKDKDKDNKFEGNARRRYWNRFKTNKQ